jgi:hypothetical protein
MKGDMIIKTKKSNIKPNEILLANYGTNYNYDRMNPGFLQESRPDGNGGRDPRKCRRGR